jgi:DNA-binding transcriptional MerR regulator
VNAGKADTAYLTISEVSEKLDIPAHVLRFWESKFTQVKPLKRNGGRRYYRQADVSLLMRIRDLLYNQGYTIKGAQKALRQPAAADIDLPRPAAAAPVPAAADQDNHAEARALIEEARSRLDSLLARLAN